MTDPAHSDAVPALGDGELIDDRALESRENDAFRLSDIADELVGICRHAPTPATIALYASWGSGKSSLGRILETEFKNDKEIAYTRFDARKYAETPLRRHFLSQVANGFGVKDSKYGKDLYRSIKGTDFKVTPSKVGRLIGVVLVAIAGVFAVIVGYALIASVSASEKQTYWHNFGETLRNSAGAVILSATALAAILALVSQSLTVDTSTEAPSSSEEFERLFKELVDDALEKKKRKRLVIFIDELDRCSPDQVVSVLETLRTFLEVKSCVFVVAADQQALERAATDAARQATPVNPGNPYYSAGSAYLDKIFQYQFPMPPLLPRRLSRFALDLIEGRPGVWHSPQEARHAAQDVLSEFAPISTPATIESVLNGARRRVVGAWPTWLDPIDAEAAAQPASQRSLVEFVTALWQKRFNPGTDQTPATDEEFEAAADSIARLAPNGLEVSAESSQKLLASLSPTAVTTQAELNAREEQIGGLWSLAGRKLLSPARVGSLVVADLDATLVAAVPAPYAPAIATYVVGEATRALRHADELGEAGDAISSSPWLDEPNKLILRARLAIAETRLGLDTSDNLAGEELIELKDQGTAEGFAALDGWLRTFKPDPEVIISLFDAETRSRTMISAAVRDAVGEVADKWTAGEKARFFESLAPLYHSGGAGDALLHLGHTQEADASRVAAVLHQLFEASGNNDERERVLQLWSIARPPAPAAQRLLADKVFIPLLGKGKDAIRLALTHFDLVQHMTGNPRDRIKKALQDATRDDSDLGKRADKRMRDAGWIKKKKPWWKIA